MMKLAMGWETVFLTRLSVFSDIDRAHFLNGGFLTHLQYIVLVSLLYFFYNVLIDFFYAFLLLVSNNHILIVQKINRYWKLSALICG